MKKKVLAILSAACVLAMSAMPAFAKESAVTTDANTKASVVVDDGSIVTSATVSEGFEVTAPSEANKKATVEYVVGQLEKASELPEIKSVAGDSDTKITAKILAVVDVEASTAVKDGDYYVFTLKIDGVKTGDIILVYHLKDDGTFEKVSATVTADGQVQVKSTSLSPFSVTKVTVEKTSNSSDSSSSNSTTSTATTTPTSPKTGEAAPFVLIIAVVSLAGAAVCGKKYFAR